MADCTILSPNCTRPRADRIRKITVHHMAGDLSVERCGGLFASPARQASSNYGIGSDGRVGLYVRECDRSWCSGDADNDNQAVTIEVAKDEYGGDWHVSDRALSSLIELCADICVRNGIERLNYTGDASGNLTTHRMFQATTCPGAYLVSKMPYIADEVNKRLGKRKPAVDVYYRVYANGSWLDAVRNYNDRDCNGYAGIIGCPLEALMSNASEGIVRHRMHVIGGGWTSWVDKCDFARGGYSGKIGFAADGLQMSLAGVPGRGLRYRVHLLGGGWLDWVTEYGAGDDGYAGI